MYAFTLVGAEGDLGRGIPAPNPTDPGCSHLATACAGRRFAGDSEPSRIRRWLFPGRRVPAECRVRLGEGFGLRQRSLQSVRGAPVRARPLKTVIHAEAVKIRCSEDGSQAGDGAVGNLRALESAGHAPSWV